MSVLTAQNGRRSSSQRQRILARSIVLSRPPRPCLPMLRLPCRRIHCPFSPADRRKRVAHLHVAPRFSTSSPAPGCSFDHHGTSGQSISCSFHPNGRVAARVVHMKSTGTSTGSLSSLQTLQRPESASRRKHPRFSETTVACMVVARLGPSQRIV